MKTDQQFKQEVYDLVENEYKFLEDYKGSMTKIKVLHTKCGYTYKVTPNNFLRGKRCPKCAGNIRKTTRQFNQEVKSLVGDEYTILTPYKNARTKILVKHNKCGYTYKVTPNDFLKGNRCPKCIKNRKKNTDDFKQEVYNLVGDEYTVLGKYKNSKTKVLLRHNKCGNEYDVLPSAFLRGTRCPKCFKNKRKTTEQFKEEVYNLVGSEYTVLSEYKNSKTKVLMKHNKCGSSFYTFPNNFLKGNRCPKCAGNMRKTTRQFSQEVYNLVGDEYSVLGEYVGSNIKILMKHNKCGNEYEVSPSAFLQGARCPQCKGGVRKTPKQFERDFYSVAQDNYKLLSVYKNSHTKVKVKHLSCGNVYMVNPTAFLRGERCPRCFGNHRKTQQEFEDIIYNLTEGDYVVLSKYKNANTKVVFKHKICGKNFSMTPYDFIGSGHRCPWCFQSCSSHGNSMIAKVLSKLGIKYYREFKFSDCKDKRKLPFDFYLPDYNLCIEYDGKQHFDRDSKFYSTDLVKHDRIKDQFCLDNNINLLRIKYTSDTLSSVRKLILESVAGIEANSRVQTHYAD